MRQRNDWTLWQRFIHWRMSAARRDKYGAILYRRQNPERLRRVQAREDRWTRLWIDTFRRAAR